MKTISYLLLGEGDFSYSLDLCRYLAAMSPEATTRRECRCMRSPNSEPQKPLESSDCEPAIFPSAQEDAHSESSIVTGTDMCKSGGMNTNSTMTYSITCTGIDSLDELHNKYKDINFFLRNIQRCSDPINNIFSGKNHENNKIVCQNRTSDNSASIEVRKSGSSIKIETTILHGVNAVQDEYNCHDGNQLNRIHHYDNVIFNHPHLGTEDAQLHFRFLHHLFHASEKRWLKPGYNKNESTHSSLSSRNTSTRYCTYHSEERGGLLYLTLVKGQFQRWRCSEAAKKHGLVLIRRFPFFPPPAPKASKDKMKTYYNLRRHQSGKSFSNRRRLLQTEEHNDILNSALNESDSETFVYGRACDYPFFEDKITSSIQEKNTNEGIRRLNHNHIGVLPWEELAQLDVTSCNLDHTSMNRPMSNLSTDKDFICSYCTKSFRENRSLKNHIVSTHPDCPEVHMTVDERKKKKKGHNKRCKKNQSLVCTVLCDQRTKQSALCFNTERRENPNDGIQITPPIHGPPWRCDLCKTSEELSSSSQNSQRIFPHLQSLMDHKRAKHYGIHLDIKPSWYQEDENNNNNNVTVERNTLFDICFKDQKQDSLESCSYGACSVCSLSFSNEGEKIKHAIDFVPSSFLHTSRQFSMPSTQLAISYGESSKMDHSKYFSFKCFYCAKSFRDLRAQQQHENYCCFQKLSQ